MWQWREGREGGLFLPSTRPLGEKQLPSAEAGGGSGAGAECGAPAQPMVGGGRVPGVSSGQCVRWEEAPGAWLEGRGPSCTHFLSQGDTPDKAETCNQI